MAVSSSSSLQAFSRGQRVEVQIREHGFEESYYLANIVARFPPHEYLVQYRTLIDEDETGKKPHREFVFKGQVRPMPLPIVVADYSAGDVVDAYYRDGWWVGKVVRQVAGMYVVYIRVPNEEIPFPFSHLRIHQDFEDGVWVYAKK